MRGFRQVFGRRIAIVALCLTASCNAQAASPVGTRSLVFDDRSTKRRLAVEVFFEATPSAKVEGFAARAPFRTIDLARGAAPAVLPKRPLIVLSHGNWGTPFSQGWLARELVIAGHVVVSLAHPGTAADDQTVAGRYRLWDRARDVTFVLDEVLRHSEIAPLIDSGSIGFVGHSFGGWTGVALAGGLYDPKAQQQACAAMSKKDFYCETTLKEDVSAIAADDARKSYADPRIRTFYIMASGPAQGFSQASLQAIRAPFLIDTATEDEVLAAGPNSSHLAKHIPGAVEIKRPVGHFVYVPQCKTIIGPVITWALGVPICNDPKGVDRAMHHKQIATDVIAFFAKPLRNGK